MSLFVLLTPVRVFTTTLESFKVVVVIAFSYVISRLIKAATERNREALFSLLGTLALLLATVNDMLYDEQIISTTRLFPFGVFFFVFFHAFLLSLRFYNLLESVENLSKRLLKANNIKSAFLEGTNRNFQKPLKVMVENLGAERGFILLERNSIWYIGLGASSKRADINKMQFVPLERIGKAIENDFISKAVVNRVISLQETHVLQNTNWHEQFPDDPYIKTHQPKSLFCTPLLHENKLKGVLYLENNSQ